MRRILKLLALGLAVLLLYVGYVLVSDAVVVNVASVRIERPAAAVFPYLTEPSHLTRWLEGLVESRPLSQGGLRVGARSLEVVEVDGERIEMQSKVLAYEENRLLRVEIDAPILTGINDYRLAEEDGATRLEFRTETALKGLFKLFASSLHDPIQTKHEADLARLKALVEAETAAHGAAVPAFDSPLDGR